MRVISNLESECASGGTRAGDSAVCAAAVAVAGAGFFSNWANDLLALGSCISVIQDAITDYGKSQETDQLMTWVDQQFAQGYIDTGTACAALPAIAGYYQFDDGSSNYY